jgi:hypothetical protein
MKRQRPEVVCDKCKEPSRMPALVTCEVHSLDLCERHMRKHFDRAACRLMPVEREPTPFDRMMDGLKE